MKFEIEEEVLAPQDFTFTRMTDFIRYEEAAIRYGADIRRVEGFHSVAEGMAWKGTVTVYGKTRQIESAVTVYDRPHQARVNSTVGGLEVTVDMGFDEVSDGRSLLVVVATLRPTTLTARLILQTIKLARRRIHARIEARIVALANEVELEYSRRQNG